MRGLSSRRDELYEAMRGMQAERRAYVTASRRQIASA